MSSVPHLPHGLLDDDDIRLRLSADIFVPDANEDGLGRLEAALGLIVDARHDPEQMLRHASVRGALAAEPDATLAERAAAQGVITADELPRPTAPRRPATLSSRSMRSPPRSTPGSRADAPAAHGVERILMRTQPTIRQLPSGCRQAVP